MKNKFKSEDLVEYAITYPPSLKKFLGVVMFSNEKHRYRKSFKNSDFERVLAKMQKVYNKLIK